MLPRNSVSPATSFSSAGMHRLMLPCVCPGVCSTWNSVAPTTSRSPSFAATSISTGSGVRHAQPLRLHVHHLLQLPIVRIHVDRRAGGLFQFLRAADMIDVRVSDYDGLHRQAVPPDHCPAPANLVAGIHHQGLARRLVAEDRAVALQRAHRQDLMDHTPIVYSKAMSDVLTIIMRWLHISSMATLVGGILYARLVDGARHRRAFAGIRQGTGQPGRGGLSPAGHRGHGRPDHVRHLQAPDHSGTHRAVSHRCSASSCCWCCTCSPWRF